MNAANRNAIAALVCIAAVAPSLATLASAQASPKVPLVAGLTITRAVRAIEGDYESMSRVDAITPRGVELTISGDVPQGDGKRAAPVTVSRIVRVADLNDAHTFKFFFNTMDDALIPGTTAIGLSAAAVAEIRAHGQSSLILDGRRGGLAGLVDDLLGGAGKSGVAGELLGGGGAVTPSVLSLVERAPVGVSVLLNGERVTLACFHVRGRTGSGKSAEDAELYVVDDPANPLVLRLAIGRDTTEVTRIDMPVPGASSAMERALSSTRRTVAYGIYFDFNSATLKPQSETVLRQIVDLMKREPTWSLKIEGHTDNIGGSVKNLDLSARRAAAVRQALVHRGVAATRLETSGLGESVPRESNASLAGRARNRRVELARV